MDPNSNVAPNPQEGLQSSQDDIQVLFDGAKSDEDDVEVVLELSKYSTKETSQDSNKIRLLKHINSFLGLSTTHLFDDDSLLTGKSLLNWLQEWFPHMEQNFLQGISKSQAVRNCQASLADLYNSITTGSLGDHSISMESTNDVDSILSGGGITSHFPYIRCRLTPDSLISEQQRQNTFEKANISDMLLDNLYRYAESFYLKRYHVQKFCGPSCNCNHPRVSDTHNLERIDFIAHPKLFAQYEKEKEKYRNRKILINEKLLFHGTHATNLNNILSDNFKLTADPVSRNKLNMYGKGIYFSDFPSKSLRYGEALLLCKVILGKEEVVQLGCKPVTSDEYFKLHYDSRKMVNGVDKKDGPANIYMVPSPRQILPCYVIYLKKKGIRNDDGIGNTGQILPLPNQSSKPQINQKAIQIPNPDPRKLGKRNKIEIFTVPLALSVFPIRPYLREVQDEYDKQYKQLNKTKDAKVTGDEKENLFGLGIQVS